MVGYWRHGKMHGPMTCINADRTSTMEDYDLGVKCSTKPLHDSKIDVLYFPVHARASPIVMMLGHQKVDFTVSTMTFEDWPAAKADKKRVPAGSLPVMDIDGKKYTESMAMMRMLGIKLGIYDPKDPVFTYHCDLILDKFSDCVEASGKFTQNPKDEAHKKKYCTLLEKLMGIVCD